VSWRIVQADVVEALRREPDASFDALLSDVPYGLGNREPTLNEIVAYLRGEELDTGGDFMGKRWSVPSVAFWREVFRVLKPGAPLLVFAGTRTQDLISIGMRAAGFEIRDAIVDWVYASGFPKSLDISKAIDKAAGHWRGRAGAVTIAEQPAKGTEYERTDKGEPVTAAAAALQGWGTALKPAREPVILARKPLDGTVVENVLTHGVGGINIDGCRVGYAGEADQEAAAAAAAAQRLCRDQNENRSAYGDFNNGPASLQPYLDKQALGRWPANLTLRHLDECRVVGTRETTRSIIGNTDGPKLKAFADGGLTASRAEVAEVYSCASGCPVAELDRQSGNRPGMSGGGVHRDGYGGGMFGGIDSADTARNDNGGASRFFFCAKASRAEREFGCDNLPTRSGAEAVDREEDSPGTQSPRAGAGRTADRVRNHHPCVKPIALTKWLATLVLPPPRADGKPRRIVVPFAGSGSEMAGTIRAGWDEVIGIEREAEYVAIAEARLRRWSEVPAHLDEADALRTADKPTAGQVPLFGKVGS